MPTYTTISETADVMQDKTVAFKVIPVSSDIDLGYFWQKCAGLPDNKLKVTLKKPDGTLITKTAEDDEVLLVNTNPQQIKVLIDAAADDVDFVGALTFYPEFKIDDSWVQADPVEILVVNDPIAEA